jgi:hypothetical protein
MYFGNENTVETREDKVSQEGKQENMLKWQSREKLGWS